MTSLRDLECVVSSRRRSSSSSSNSSSCPSTSHSSLSSAQSTSEKSFDYVSCRKRHRWSLDEKVVLLILYRWFATAVKNGDVIFPPRDMRSVLQEYFAEEIDTRVNLDSLSVNAISTQLQQLRSDGEREQAWCLVYLETDFEDREARWATIKANLRIAAAKVGITLRTRIVENETAQTRERKNNRFPRKRRPVYDYSEDSEDGFPRRKRKRLLAPAPTPRTPGTPADLIDKKCYLYTPSSGKSIKRSAIPTIRAIGKEQSKTSNKVPQKNSLLQTALSNLKRCQKSARRPIPDGYNVWKREMPLKKAVAFRFFDLDSSGLNTAGGFLAGRFTDMENKECIDLQHTEDPVPPADFFSDEFVESAFQHLTRVKKPTPFISLRENLLSVMHHGLISKTKACVAFVDLRYISLHQPFHFPRLFPGFKISQRLKELGKVQDNFYSAYGEWLVWDRIETEAVVACFSVDRFRRYMERYPRIKIVLRLEELEKCTGAGDYKKYKRMLKKTALQLDLSLDRNSGTSIGHFLAFTGLSKINLKDVALKIGRNWKLIGSGEVKRKGPFLEGVEDGFEEYFTDLGKNNEIDIDEFALTRKKIKATLGSKGKLYDTAGSHHCPMVGVEINQPVVDPSFQMDLLGTDPGLIACARVWADRVAQADQMDRYGDVGCETVQEKFNTEPAPAELHLISRPDSRSPEISETDHDLQDHNDVTTLLSDLNLNNEHQLSNRSRNLTSLPSHSAQPSPNVQISLDRPRSTYKPGPNLQFCLRGSTHQKTSNTQRYKNSLFKPFSPTSPGGSTGKHTNFSKYLYRPTQNSSKGANEIEVRREVIITSKYFFPSKTSDQRTTASSHQLRKQQIISDSSGMAVNSMARGGLSMSQPTRRKLFEGEIAARAKRGNGADDDDLSAPELVVRSHSNIPRRIPPRIKNNSVRRAAVSKPSVSRPAESKVNLSVIKRFKRSTQDSKAKNGAFSVVQLAANLGARVSRPDASKFAQSNHWRSAAAAEPGVEVFATRPPTSNNHNLRENEVSAVVTNAMDWLSDYNGDDVLPSIETDVNNVEAWREKVFREKFEDTTSQTIADLASRRSSSATTGIIIKAERSLDAPMETHSRPPNRIIQRITLRESKVETEYVQSRSDEPQASTNQARVQVWDSQDAQRVPDSQIVIQPSPGLALDFALPRPNAEEGEASEDEDADIENRDPGLPKLNTDKQEEIFTFTRREMDGILSSSPGERIKRFGYHRYFNTG